MIVRDGGNVDASTGVFGIAPPTPYEIAIQTAGERAGWNKDLTTQIPSGATAPAAAPKKSILPLILGGAAVVGLLYFIFKK